MIEPDDLVIPRGSVSEACTDATYNSAILKRSSRTSPQASQRSSHSCWKAICLMSAIIQWHLQIICENYYRLIGNQTHQKHHTNRTQTTAAHVGCDTKMLTIPKKALQLFENFATALQLASSLLFSFSLLNRLIMSLIISSGSSKCLSYVL